MGTLNTGGESVPSYGNFKTFEDLREVRDEIDIIDDKLIELLNQRAELVLVARGFKRVGTSTYDVVREHEIIANVLEKNEGPFEDTQVSTIFFTILKESRGLQAAEAKKAEVAEEIVS